MPTSKPFLLLSSRPQDNITASEYDTFARFTGLGKRRLIQHRLEREPLTDFDPDEWAGVILAGSPFNSTVPDEQKSPAQRSVERSIFRLLDRLVPLDYPFLGVCYGIGTLLVHQGARISRAHGEGISAPTVTLTAAGRSDPLLRGIPDSFTAYVGHTEAADSLPEGAVLLASSPKCPVQLFRIGRNMYGTQFHPELTWPALHMRILEYRTCGYYPADEQDRVIAQCRDRDVTASNRVLRNFAEIYG